MMLKQNIYLIGPMGAGKTSVGKQLAKFTGGQFIDSDNEIEKRTGVSIAWIFEKEKEVGFRQREANIIVELTQRKNIILSTGGGSILAEKNRQYLKSTGFVVYLKVSLDVQFERISQRKEVRPLLNQPNPKQKLSTLNESREPVYTSLADLIIDTDNNNPFEIAEMIFQQIRDNHDIKQN